MTSRKHPVVVVVVVAAGSEGGLQLELNIEQYEYMRGPDLGAGLRVLLHNQREVPLVKNHGLALMPGTHASIAVKTVEVFRTMFSMNSPMLREHFVLISVRVLQISNSSSSLGKRLF